MGFSLTEYFEKYGHDIEIAERQQKQVVENEMREWFQNAATLLCQMFDDIVGSAVTLAPGDGEIRRLVGEAAVYQMLLGADEGTEWYKQYTGGSGQTIPRYSYRPYQQLFGIFLENRSVNCTYAVAQESVQQHMPKFWAAGHLTKDSYGAFWLHLFKALPVYEENRRPYELGVILDRLGGCYALFHGNVDENDWSEKLEDILDVHWQRKCVCAPDGNAAEEAVRKRDVWNDSCPVRSLLVTRFPEITQMWEMQDLSEMDEVDILGEVYQQKPDLAVKMWRLILDTAEGCLMDPKAAEQIIQDTMEFVWNDDVSLWCILKEMKEDDHFAQQVFQSAYVGYVQEDLLKACDLSGEPELKEHLLELLHDNPFGDLDEEESEDFYRRIGM